jgi:hypothetical protein
MMSSSDPSSAAFSGSGTDASPIQNISALYTRTQRQYQQILDRWTPYMLYRWLSTAGLLAVFFLRIVLAQGVSSSLFTFNHSDFLPVVHWSVISLQILYATYALVFLCGF